MSSFQGRDASRNVGGQRVSNLFSLLCLHHIILSQLSHVICPLYFSIINTTDAYINSWGQMFQGGYISQTGVQVHEMGHNLNLAHSGSQGISWSGGSVGSGGYTDHTCMMGKYETILAKFCSL